MTACYLVIDYTLATTLQLTGYNKPTGCDSVTFVRACVQWRSSETGNRQHVEVVAVTVTAT